MDKEQVWAPYPYSKEAFSYTRATLEPAWPRLHRGDREPFPSEAWTERVCQQSPELARRDLSASQAAADLAAAWCSFHCGDFEQAAAQGLALGPLGFNVANKAANTQANYLEQEASRKLELYQQVMQRAEQLQRAAPELANAWYYYAYAAGRYAQQIAVTRALAEGVAAKVQRSLQRALELEPEHADAHTATGVYHTEIIDKVGALIGKMTYGADRDAAMRHFRRGIELAPESASALMEYADGLLMLYGRSKRGEAVGLYERAAAIDPQDSLEQLDVALAKSQLE